MVPLFGALKHNPSKNRERGRTLALGGFRLIMANNNQPKVGSSSRLDVISERVGVGSTGGCMVQSFGAANKIHRGLRWPPIDAFVLNNQPKTVGRDGGDYGWEA